VICNFVCFAPWIAYLVGPVEPVELHGIFAAQVEPPGVTGGTGASPASHWHLNPVPPVTPTGITKNHRKALQYHRFHRLHLPHNTPRDRQEKIFRRSLESTS
jgi:hypothetical protein